MNDETQVTAIAEHVRSAMEGVFLQGRVSGTITYGYTGREIPGQKTNKGLPARIIVVDPVTSERVRRAFAFGYMLDRHAHRGRPGIVILKAMFLLFRIYAWRGTAVVPGTSVD